MVRRRFQLRPGLILAVALVAVAVGPIAPAGAQIPDPDAGDDEDPLAPESPQERIADARAHYAAGRFAAALDQLRQAQDDLGTHLPGDARRLLQLCTLLDTAQGALGSFDLLEAEAAARKALAIEPDLDAAKVVLEAIERIDEILAEKGSLPDPAITSRTDHIIIQHHQPRLVERLLPLLERERAALVAKLGGGASTTWTIRIARDREAHVVRTGELGETNDVVATAPTDLSTFQEVAAKELPAALRAAAVDASIPKSLPGWARLGLREGGYALAPATVYADAASRLAGKTLAGASELLALETLDSAMTPAPDLAIGARLLVELLTHAKGDRETLLELPARIRKLARERRKKGTGAGADPAAGVLAVYGYGSVAGLDADLARWIAHRKLEAPRQEKQRRQPVAARGWKPTLQLDSESFTLFTTCDRPVAENALELAEKVRATFIREFWDTGILIPGRVTIYLFDKSTEFAAFLRPHGIVVKKGDYITPHYNPALGAACMGREGISRDYLAQCVAHEVTHALAWHLMKSAGKGGSWVVEGIAHYVGLSVHARTGEIELGEVHETKLSRAASFFRLMKRDGKMLPLAPFIDLRQWDMRTTRHHVQCFGLFHFLRHDDDGARRAGLQAYLRAITATGDGRRPTFEEHLGDVSEVERALGSYASGWKPTSKKR